MTNTLNGRYMYLCFWPCRALHGASCWSTIPFASHWNGNKMDYFEYDLHCVMNKFGVYSIFVAIQFQYFSWFSWTISVGRFQSFLDFSWTISVFLCLWCRLISAFAAQFLRCWFSVFIQFLRLVFAPFHFDLRFTLALFNFDFRWFSIVLVTKNMLFTKDTLEISLSFHIFSISSLSQFLWSFMDFFMPLAISRSFHFGCKFFHFGYNFFRFYFVFFHILTFPHEQSLKE